MVDILSKRSGPRREDAQIKRIISENQGTITRLADHLSSGAYSASRKPKQQPQPRNLVIVHGPATASDAPPSPYVRVSPNGRVVVMDGNTGRQLHHLGDLRGVEGRTCFRLATSGNGYIAPLDGALASALAALDGKALEPGESDARFAARVEAALGLA
ncbi:hypothetical protein [Acidisoma sp. 7E03]